MKRLRLLVLCFNLLLGCYTAAQNTIGIPTIVNYSKQLYSAGTQNWGIAQDKNGIIYFANNQGLLSFDGSFWRKYSLPNKTIVRSIAIDDDGRIYVGGQSELGYFYPAKNGELVYTSLLPLLHQNANDFTDVWNICLFQHHVFFRAYKKVFEYDKKKMIVYDGIHWNFLGLSANSLLAFEYNKGLVAYQQGKWVPAINSGKLATDINIKASVVIGNDSTLLVTLTNGLYVLHHDSIATLITKDIQSITGQNVYGAAMLAPDRIALITNLSGCIVINKQGRFIQRLSKKEGIQNNNILSLLLDKDKNLWLGLDNGIDLVLYNNAIKNIFPEQEDRNAGFTSTVYKNQLYLGLASGAYKVPLQQYNDISYTTGSFELVEGSKGQVWNFSEVNDKLLIGHNGGAYIVDKNKAIAFDDKTGFWNFQSLLLPDSRVNMMAGNYNGINFYSYQNGHFINPRIHAHFESARFVLVYDNRIWVAHPFKGLFEVSFNSQHNPVVATYKDKNKILSPNHNKLFKIDEKMLLTTDNGIFEYDDNKDDFIRATAYESAFGRMPISYLKEDLYGNIWFSRDKKIGVLDRTFTTPRIVFIPELNNRIQADGFENITVLDSNNVLIAGEKGFFHLNYAAYKKTHSALQVLIRNVRTIAQDSLIFGGYSSLPSHTEISYGYNSLHFESSSPLFGQENTLEYRYYLDGFDKEWSEWAKKTEKDYTNIPPGHYIFKAKCRNNFDNESPVSSFSFIILPPWYRTWWAYILYSFIFIGLLRFFYKRQRRKYMLQQQEKLREQQKKYAEKQKQLKMLHQLELAETEKKIAQLEQEKLHAEVKHKNTELASSAMNLVHKVEILSKLKEDLVHLKDGAAAEKSGKELQKIIKLIDGELNHAQEWEQFSQHFDNVHTNYLQKLKAYCPDLTTSELKLAAYLRLNLTTKEIAQLMNISVRGVETSRYRLRKKLGLTNDEGNLYDFLIHITK